jgi:aspartyl-tRNA(Asn)/glutamyl-tRNA(Gln) amidotransferase subunit A
LGSDTGGSIRVPAALCGITGLKPTYGRVSLRGVLPLSWNLDHAGPMARRVEDVALLLQAIAGYDPGDPYSIKMRTPDYLANLKAGVRGWRIALIDDPYLAVTTPEIRQLVSAAAQVFAQLGAQVTTAALPGAYEAAVANGLMVTSDAAAYHQERLAQAPEDFGEDVRQRLRAGAAYTSTQYIQARRTQTLTRRRYEQLFEQFDLLLLPTTAVPALPIEGPDAVEQARVYTRFTAPFNLTGLPALSLPCGFTADRLPVGLQLVGPAWAEAQLLRAGFAYQAATPWSVQQPPLALL